MKRFMLISRIFLVIAVLAAAYLVFNSKIKVEIDKPDVVQSETNSQPRAVAGIVDTRVTIYGGGVSHLDGSGSYDNDGGRIVRYRWTIVDAPEADKIGEVVYDGPEAKAPDQSYDLADVGSWVYGLEVTDDEGLTGQDIKRVYVAEKIYSILEPIKVPAETADFLTTDDLVLGVTINGESVAYPAKVVYPHILVNDTVGDQPIYVVFCEACQTGTVKKREVGDLVLTFKGLGGSLEEEDYRYKDIETGSEWQVIYGEAKAGELVGVVLEDEEFEIIPWSQWLAEHPYSLVLSEE